MILLNYFYKTLAAPSNPFSSLSTAVSLPPPLPPAGNRGWGGREMKSDF